MRQGQPHRRFFPHCNLLPLAVTLVAAVTFVLVDSFGVVAYSSVTAGGCPRGGGFCTKNHQRQQQRPLRHPTHAAAAITSSSSSSSSSSLTGTKSSPESYVQEQKLWDQLLTEYSIPKPFWKRRVSTHGDDAARRSSRSHQWAGNFAYLVEQVLEMTDSDDNQSNTPRSHPPKRGPVAADQVMRRLWRECTPNKTSSSSSNNNNNITTTNNNNNKHTPMLFRITTLNKILAAYQRQISNKQTPYRQQQQLADAAQKLFDDWQQKLHNYYYYYYTEPVDRVSFNTLMDIWAKVGRPDQVQCLFDTMTSSWPPDNVSYNSLLHAYAIAGHANRVQDILRHMQAATAGRSSGSISSVAPTVRCYNNVLLAHARSDHASAAYDFLQEWIANCTTVATRNSTTRDDDDDDDDDSLELRPPAAPDVTSYNIVLHALTQQPNNRFMRTRAETLFHTMPVRDVVSYTTLVAAYCRLTNSVLALEAVRRTLQRAMEELVGVMDAAFCANILYSVANINSKETLAFAESFVETVQREYGVEVDISVYNALLYCYSKITDRLAPTKALDLLSKLEQDEHVQPNIKTYTNVLKALKSRGLEAVTQAERIFKRLKNQDSPVKPNIQAYTSLIEIYSKSKLYFKVQKAWQVLQRMKAENIPPNIVSYNAVLNACEYTDPTSDLAVTEEALKVACLVFDEIRSNPNVQPNHVTYGTFLGVLAKLMPAARRQEIVELVFRRCCKEGQVSRLVLKKLQAAAAVEGAGTEKNDNNDDWYRQILLQGHSEGRLPREWTKNVREAPARKEV